METPEQAFAQALRESLGDPARAELADQAAVRLQDGLILIPREPAIRLLTVNNRAVPPDFVALLLGHGGMETLGYIRFVSAGYTDADTILSWSPDDILDSLRDTVERENANRIRQNLQEQEARRWVRAPRYSPEDHQLSWAALIVPKTAPRESGGEITTNALAFGREGYIQLTIASSLQQAENAGHMADSFLQGLSFRPGKAVPDVQPGDRRAPGGLPAAMGIDSLHKARAPGGMWPSDPIVPLTGSVVAGIGAVSLFIYIQRHLRRRARRV